MFKSNVKFYVKSTISSTQGTGTTFNISEDFETGTNIETGTDVVSIVLKTSTQIERMTITATGGVATIVKRGLTQADTKVEDPALRRQWTDGTIGYITALASDLLDIDKENGVISINSDIEFTGNTEFAGPTKIPTFADDTARDLVYTSPTNGDTCFIVGVGQQVYNGGVWVTLDEGTPTPNASETVAGKVEIATQTQVDTPTDTGGTGAINTVIPSTFQQGITNRIADDTSIDNGTSTIYLVSPAGLQRKIRTTQSTFTAGEDITAGNALYIHTDGKVYKTDASNTDKINFIGFATNTATTGNNVIVDTGGVSNTQSGLTIGSDYYLSNTPGVISTTPGTNIVSVGKAVSATQIEINVFDKQQKSICVSGTITTDDVAQSNIVINHNLGVIPRSIIGEINLGKTIFAAGNGIDGGYATYDGTTITQKAYDGYGNSIDPDFFIRWVSGGGRGIRTITSITTTQITLTYSYSGSLSTEIWPYRIILIG